MKGNPGNRPVNTNEPQPQGAVKKPSFVTKRAARIWKQYAPELQRQGVLTSNDVDMFGTWCCLMAEFQESPQHFPASRISQMRALASTFGLDPSSRTRLGTPTPKGQKEKDPAEKYFAS